MSQSYRANNQPFQLMTSHREHILTKLRERGCRITNQRKLILDIILKNNCSCCKEIYYEAALSDPSIGIATVYRMVNMLEEMKIINRKNLYHIELDEFEEITDNCAVFISGEKKIDLTGTSWFDGLKKFLKEAGYIDKENISVVVRKA